MQGGTLELVYSILQAEEWEGGELLRNLTVKQYSDILGAGGMKHCFGTRIYVQTASEKMLYEV